MHKSLKRLVWVGHAEGISYLILLLIAMPLKYMMGMPTAVKLVGSAHGVLFVLFIFALLNAFMDKQMSIKQGIWFFILSFIPFGTFFIERNLKAAQ